MAINSLGKLTSADATIILSVNELYPNGVKLEGFSTDAMMATEDVTIAEARMGVDGRLSAGYIPSPKNITITLEATSPSLEVMQTIFNYNETTLSQPECTMTITIPSLQEVITLTQGCLTKGRPIPDLKKLLDPTNWGFTFARYKISAI